MVLMKKALLLSAFGGLLLIANVTEAQSPAFTKRLHSPASVRGFIGGESHDSYVIHVRSGRVLTVRISWRQEGDNRAEFDVSESPNSDGEAVKFGKWSENNKRWTGSVQKTGDYSVQVVAHPTAHNTLRVTVK
jgi:hypothetical protein